MKDKETKAEVIRLEDYVKDKQERISGIKFCWDSEKENENIRKHGLSFRIEARIFEDDNRLEIYDRWHDLEERYNTIGLAEDVLFVVYTERRDSIRIISARVATTVERRLYYDSIL